MPMYSFHCSSCDAVESVLQLMSEYTGEYPCEECSGVAVRSYEEGAPTMKATALDKHGRAEKSGSWHKGFSKKFMEENIEAAKEAIEFKTGVNPYSKRTMDMEAMADAGILRRTDRKTAEARIRNGQKIAGEVAKAMTETEKNSNHLGKRADG